MKIITLDREKMEIWFRRIDDAPDTKITKNNNFEENYFYLAHIDGISYLQFDASELMNFIKVIYGLSTMDLFEQDDLDNIISETCSIYYAVNFNGNKELRPFSYNNKRINTLSDLFKLYYEELEFKNGFNINLIKAL